MSGHMHEFQQNAVFLCSPPPLCGSIQAETNFVAQQGDHVSCDDIARLKLKQCDFIMELLHQSLAAVLK